jgi:hypothetical protein
VPDPTYSYLLAQLLARDQIGVRQPGPPGKRRRRNRSALEGMPIFEQIRQEYRPRDPAQDLYGREPYLPQLQDFTTWGGRMLDAYPGSYIGDNPNPWNPYNPPGEEPKYSWDPGYGHWFTPSRPRDYATEPVVPPEPGYRGEELFQDPYYRAMVNEHRGDLAHLYRKAGRPTETNWTEPYEIAGGPAGSVGNVSGNDEWSGEWLQQARQLAQRRRPPPPLPMAVGSHFGGVYRS